MPDHLTRSIVVNAWKLENLRDTLRERAEELSAWNNDLVKAQVVNVTDEFGNVCSNELKDFLYELHGDLNDWLPFLSEQIGDDAE